MNYTLRLKLIIALTTIILSITRMTLAVNIDRSAIIRQTYTKQEVMIGMRDSVRLYTAIYAPKDTTVKHPILITRTPYGNAPYGKDFDKKLWNNFADFVDKGYIIVNQDVRGQYMSEGDFTNIKPVGKGSHDESTDTYDTVEWLLNHTNNNGCIGVTGCSYPGFYALMAGVSRHPAIKAVCLQAPVSDWFMGDDIHHNGALMLSDSFRFLSGFSRPRSKPCTQKTPTKSFYEGDEYSFFLKIGAIKNITTLFADSILFWNEMMRHPNYDNWWKSRCSLNHCHDFKAAVMVVGGVFDAEDCYGTFSTYRAIAKNSSQIPLYLLIGPWSHNAWNHTHYTQLGDICFSKENLNQIFTKQHADFFNHFLLGENTLQNTPVAKIFITGENKWQNFSAWPPTECKLVTLFLNNDNSLSFLPERKKQSTTKYVSNPAYPVPYIENMKHSRSANYMIADQRYAEKNSGVATFTTTVLDSALTICGELEADIWMSSNTTDADIVIKLIDVYPITNNNDKMSGYEMLVRGDVMRARYRESFEHPTALKPGVATHIKFKLPDIAHTFAKGHRVMIQIQSSWFPLVDRNPQQMIDIYHCSDTDYIPATITIYHDKNHPSGITFHQSTN